MKYSFWKRLNLDSQQIASNQMKIQRKNWSQFIKLVQNIVLYSWEGMFSR